LIVVDNFVATVIGFDVNAPGFHAGGRDVAHVPEISFFVCAEAVATARANTVQLNRIFAIMFFSPV
jgi:hypothetical protein